MLEINVEQSREVPGKAQQSCKLTETREQPYPCMQALGQANKHMPYSQLLCV